VAGGKAAGLLPRQVEMGNGELALLLIQLAGSLVGGRVAGGG
jgi:hypothetical protein